jgi:hypothetical protein
MTPIDKVYAAITDAPWLRRNTLLMTKVGSGLSRPRARPEPRRPFAVEGRTRGAGDPDGLAAR